MEYPIHAESIAPPPLHACTHSQASPASFACARHRSLLSTAWLNDQSAATSSAAMAVPQRTQHQQKKECMFASLSWTLA